MFASIPNYKEFYIENDLNKQARAAQDYMYQIFMFWMGSAGLYASDFYVLGGQRRTKYVPVQQMVMH